MTLQKLQDLGLIHSAEETAASLNQPDPAADAPPLLARVALVIGAWLSGIFLCIFFGLLFDDIFDYHPAATILGLVVVAGSLVLFRKTSGLFLEQLALALNFAGTALFMIGTVAWMDDLIPRGSESTVALVSVAILCPIVFAISRNPVQQFLSLAWVYAAGWFVAFEENFLPLLLLLVAVSLFLFLWSWMGKGEKFLNASTKFASLISFLGILVSVSLADSFIRDSLVEKAAPIIRALVPLALGGLVIWLHRDRDGKRILGGVGFTVILFAISWAGAPGVAFAIGLMVLAHLLGDRFFAGFAPFLLGLFLLLYYYFLGVPLLTKSLWLAGIGMALLLNSALLLRVVRSRILSS